MCGGVSLDQFDMIQTLPFVSLSFHCTRNPHKYDTLTKKSDKKSLRLFIIFKKCHGFHIHATGNETFKLKKCHKHNVS